MRVLCRVIAFALGIGLAGITNADQVKVNIVYPINGASYPITDPAPGALKSAYFNNELQRDMRW